MKSLNLLVVALVAACSVVWSQDEFPEPLSAAQFKELAKQEGQLHVIEFYSPYCSHCNALAPVWKDTWETFSSNDNNDKDKITFDQVNCIENADLCSLEKIAYFPSIRLYGPSGFIKNYPTGWKRTKDKLLEFAHQEARNQDNFRLIKKADSQALAGEKLAQILKGQVADKPYLLSFWPSKNMKSTMDSSVFFENCDDCIPFQRVWNLLSSSSKLQEASIATGHINCEANKDVCNSLGFENLSSLKNHRAEREPRVVLALPTTNGGMLTIKYKGSHSDPSDLETFTIRNYMNSKHRIYDSAKFLFNSPESEEDLIYNLQDKIESQIIERPMHLVYVYDQESASVQDHSKILDSLVEPLSNIPNVYLYQTDSSIFHSMHKSIEQKYKWINYNSSEEEKTFKYNISDYGDLPAFFLFKEHDMFAPALSLNGDAKPQNIVNWLAHSTFSIINKVATLDELNKLLQDTGQDCSTIIFQIVSALDEKNIDSSYIGLYNLLMSVYDYDNLRIQQAAKKLENDESNALSDIFGGQQNQNRAVIALIDTSNTDPKVLEQARLGSRYGSVSVGDISIYSTSSKKFFQNDIFGDPLNANSLFCVRESLFELNFKSDNKKFMNMYGPSFSILASLNAMISYQPQLYVFGSIVIIAIIVFRYSMTRRQANIYRAKRDSLGLLGKKNKAQYND